MDLPIMHTFTIDINIKESKFDDLIRFIQQTYILPQSQFFQRVQLSEVGPTPSLSYRFTHPEIQGHADVQLKTGYPIHVNILFGEEQFSQGLLDKLQQDLTFQVRLFEEQVRRTSLYFAWIEGEEGIPEQKPRRRRSILHRIFADSMLSFFVLFIFINIVLFVFLGFVAVIILVALQLVMVLLSGRIIARTGDWQITNKNPFLHIFQYQLPVEQYLDFQKKYPPNMLRQLKQEIYQQTLARGQPVNCETAETTLIKYGFPCNADHTSMKLFNIYDIVKTAAEKFNVPIPRIVISNTVVPNAAASGPSPSQGVLVITTGLCAQLNEDELLAVVGHEFSHLKGRDPLVLFGLSAAEFILRFYLFFTYWWIFAVFPILYFLYTLVALGVVYFIAKFFEGRADLETAAKIGQPKVLAKALRKIGFRKLQFERIPAYRITSWTGWDPHPPLYFRIARLEQLDASQIKHPMLQSIRDNFRGFFASIRRRM